MEVDGDLLDVGVDFNEFEVEDKQPKDEDILLEMEVDEENALEGSCKISKKAEPKSGLSKTVDTQQLGEIKDTNDARNRINAARKERKDNSRSSRSKQTSNKLFKALDASPDLDPKILGREIAYRLGEHKVGLMINVVRVLGFGTAMEILEETRKIEKRGGMPTVDRNRRRQPGGVFIFCMKEMGFATKYQVNEIFKEEKQKLKEIIKRKRKEKNAKQREELSKINELKERALKYMNQNENGDDKSTEIQTETNSENSQVTTEKIETI